MPDLRAEDRWSRWGPRVTDELGFLSMTCVRLFTHEDRVGALNLFSYERNVKIAVIAQEMVTRHDRDRGRPCGSSHRSRCRRQGLTSPGSLARFDAPCEPSAERAAGCTPHRARVVAESSAPLALPQERLRPRLSGGTTGPCPTIPQVRTLCGRRTPDGIRTRATALRGRRARPLHNGGLVGAT